MILRRASVRYADLAYIVHDRAVTRRAVTCRRFRICGPVVPGTRQAMGALSVLALITALR